MVTGQLTVPCDSLSDLSSHVQQCFSPCVVMFKIVVFLQYTMTTMQQNILSFLLSKIFYFCNSRFFNLFHIIQSYIALK